MEPILACQLRVHIEGLSSHNVGNLANWVKQNSKDSLVGEGWGASQFRTSQHGGRVGDGEKEFFDQVVEDFESQNASFVFYP